MSDADCTPGREPRSVAASLIIMMTELLDNIIVVVDTMLTILISYLSVTVISLPLFSTCFATFLPYSQSHLFTSCFITRELLIFLLLVLHIHTRFTG